MSTKYKFEFQDQFIMNARCFFCNRKARLKKGEFQPYLCSTHRHFQHGNCMKNFTFQKQYKIINELDQGDWGILYNCINIKQKQSYYVRRIDLNKIGNNKDLLKLDIIQ